MPAGSSACCRRGAQVIVELLLLTGVVSLVAGALTPRKPKDEKRCAAVETERTTRDSDKYNVESHRCRALADKRCGGGNCTWHCRRPERCNGACLTAAVEKKVAAVLKMEP